MSPLTVLVPPHQVVMVTSLAALRLPSFDQATFQHPFLLACKCSKPPVYSVCELVSIIVFESRGVARAYVGVIDWLVSYAVCD